MTDDTVDENAKKTQSHTTPDPDPDKTRFTARRIIREHYTCDRPVISVDPSGGIFENIIDKINRESQVRPSLTWSDLARRLNNDD